MMKNSRKPYIYSMNISCPISEQRINENVVRLIAAFVAVIALICVATGNYFAIYFLIIDFGIRAFTNGKLSLLKFLAVKISNAFSMSPKATDLAPKKFAATMGFVFCLLIGLSFIFQFFIATLLLTVVLICFAILESVFAVCVGCYVYSFWQHLIQKRQTN